MVVAGRQPLEAPANVPRPTAVRRKATGPVLRSGRSTATVTPSSSAGAIRSSANEARSRTGSPSTYSRRSAASVTVRPASASFQWQSQRSVWSQ